MWKFAFVTFIAGLIFALPVRVIGQVIYDSHGFETDHFSSSFINATEPSITGDLFGQDAAGNPWNYVGPAPATNSTGTARIVTSSQSAGLGESGSQCVRVITGTTNDAWGPTLNYDATGKIVAIAWTMVTDFHANDGEAIGQETYIGVNAFGSSNPGGTPTLLAGLGLNMQGQQILYYDASNKPVIVPVLPNALGVSPARFEIDLNYASQNYQLLVDSREMATGTFLANATTLASVDISTWVPQSQVVFPAGGAYIDDLTVAAVPEPMIAMLPLLAVLTRRNRSRGSEN